MQSCVFQVSVQDAHLRCASNSGIYIYSRPMKYAENQTLVFFVENAATAAAVYLRSAYRIHVNSMKANRARWVLTQVNSPRRGKVSATLNLVLLWDPCLFGDFPFSSPNLRAIAHPRRACDREQWHRETRKRACHFYFHHLFFLPTRGILFARSIENLFIKICASISLKIRWKLGTHSRSSSHIVFRTILHLIQIYFLWILRTHRSSRLNKEES